MASAKTYAVLSTVVLCGLVLGVVGYLHAHQIPESSDNAQVMIDSDGERPRKVITKSHARGLVQTWILQGSGNRRPLTYLDENGNLKGFDMDIGNAVCRIAGKRCEFALYPFSDCSSRDEEGKFTPGRALTEGLVDACPGSGITEDRIPFVRFTLPYYLTFARFHVKPGNPRNFTSDDVSGRTITFLRNTYTNEACLQRFNKTYAEALPADGLNNARDNVLEERADALFAPRPTIPGVEVVPGIFDCTLGGTAIMTMPDNMFADWWNPAFEILRSTGEYKKICEECGARHGSNITCVDI